MTAPPLEEQRQLVAFINSEAEKVDVLINKAESAIQLLAEHRSTLITAASYRHTLHATFETAIRHSMLMAYARSGTLGKTPQEPDFVAALVLDGSPIIGTYLNAICAAAGGSAKLSAIFCHGKPEVTYPGATKGCELGDVLFVHFHTDENGQVSRNALLLQAKISSDFIYPMPKSDYHQLDLYRKWPCFTYTRTAPWLNGKSRNVCPKRPHHGAKYLLIDNTDPTCLSSGLLGLSGTFPMGVSPAMHILNGSQPLSIEFVDYLIGATGRNFWDIDSPGTGWSAVIWDLIRHSAVTVFNRAKQSGLVNQPRNVTTFMQQAGAGFVTSGSRKQSGVMSQLFGQNFEAWLDGGDDIPVQNIEIPESDGESGCSVVLIETSVGRQSEE